LKIPILHQFVLICEEIIRKELDVEQWSEIESSDMFQSENFCGGFDADENEFCFSYFENDDEYWFQFDLETAKAVCAKQMVELTGKLNSAY
jgi:hypothetical protein